MDLYPACEIEKEAEAGISLKLLEKCIELRIIPFSCARAALVYGLRALGWERMDEILVPPYLGHCVLSALSRTSFPSLGPSSRTKGILVFHQFGYPQHIEAITKEASKNGWVIVNDCANTIFSAFQKNCIVNWGDFSVLSFPKLYPCALGGALVSNRTEILKTIERNYEILSIEHENRVNIVYEILEKAKRNLLGREAKVEVESVYGYLPELVTFPMRAFGSLPATESEIEEDVSRRKELLETVKSYFPDRVVQCPECDVVPFAIPVAGEPQQLESISHTLKQRIGVELPILHFDFARNMLDPDYRKALIIGCHQEWTKEMVIKICEEASKEFK